MSTMSDGIERGMTRAAMFWRDGEINSHELAAVAANLIMQEPLLSDKVVGILKSKFQERARIDLALLGAELQQASDRQLGILSDDIAAWVEELERISMAIYHLIDEKDVLEALRFIDMNLSDWSDYIHQAEADNAGEPEPEQPQTPRGLLPTILIEYEWVLGLLDFQTTMELTIINHAKAILRLRDPIEYAKLTDSWWAKVKVTDIGYLVTFHYDKEWPPENGH